MRKIIVLSLIFLLSISKVHAAETDRFFTPTPDVVWGFTGQRAINETGVYHFGARFYSPTLGIFIQPDRVEGPNTYAYVRNNPVSFNDPSGKCGLPCIILLLAVYGGMSTMPMASSAPPPDNPCLYGCMTPEQAELNLSLWRTLPPIGLPIDAYELKSGRSLASGRQLGKVDQFFNVVGVATGADFLLGKAHSLAQASRVANYEGGLDLLSAKNPETVVNLMRKNYPDIKLVELPEDAGYKGAFVYPDSLDPDWEIALEHQRTVPLQVFQHEGVHALQHANNHPSFQFEVDPRVWNRFGNNFDAEMMAYASTGKGSFSWQTSASLLSSSSFVGWDKNAAFKGGYFIYNNVVNKAHLSWNYVRAGTFAGRAMQVISQSQESNTGYKRNMFQ